MSGLPTLDAATTDVARATEQLRRDGVILLRQVAPVIAASVADDLAQAFETTPFSQGPFYGDHTVRFGRLPARSAAAAALILDPLVYGVVAATLGRWHSEISLSFTQGVAVHPGAPVQVPHRDGEMWPVPPSEAEHLVNVLWPLTDFRVDNGATRVWPGSHRGGAGAAAEPCHAEMRRGDALVMLGSTLHGAGANGSDADRRAIIFGFTPAWLLPSENPALAYPPPVARTLPRALTQLLGYRRFAPNLNNVDCRCPSEFLTETGLGQGAVDELTLDQRARLEGFYARLREEMA